MTAVVIRSSFHSPPQADFGVSVESQASAFTPMVTRPAGEAGRSQSQHETPPAPDPAPHSSEPDDKGLHSHLIDNQHLSGTSFCARPHDPVLSLQHLQLISMTFWTGTHSTSHWGMPVRLSASIHLHKIPTRSIVFLTLSLHMRQSSPGGFK